MNSATWKIIRGDDAIVELSKKVFFKFYFLIKTKIKLLFWKIKKLSKYKAEGQPLPPLVKKVVKREQQSELATRDEGQGNFPGPITDVEAWFLWKLGLA